MSTLAAQQILTVPASRLDLDTLAAIAAEGGQLALSYFRPGLSTRAGVEWKGDGSPVTEADLAVDRFLAEALPRLWPGAAWLSEESADDIARLSSSRVIIVDPIDGTRGFARGDAHWAVSIALVEEGRPVCAIVHAPALGETYLAAAGGGATLNGRPLELGTQAQELRTDLRISCPGSLVKALQRAGIILDFQPKIASLALRVAKVAAGIYDAGLTTSNSHDWDIAAADLILAEAGGLIGGLDGLPIVYNRPDPTHGVLAAAARSLHPAFRAALDRVDTTRLR